MLNSLCSMLNAQIELLMHQWALSLNAHCIDAPATPILLLDSKRSTTAIFPVLTLVLLYCIVLYDRCIFHLLYPTQNCILLKPVFVHSSTLLKALSTYAPSTQVCRLIADNTLRYGRCADYKRIEPAWERKWGKKPGNKQQNRNGQQSTINGKTGETGAERKTGDGAVGCGDLGLERGSPGAPKQHRARLSLKLSPVNHDKPCTSVPPLQWWGCSEKVGGSISLTNWVNNAGLLATQKWKDAQGRWKGAIAGQLILEIHHVALLH